MSEWLKLLGITMDEIRGKWDRHFQEMMNKASKRMYILRVCKHYGLTTEKLHPHHAWHFCMRKR